MKLSYLFTLIIASALLTSCEKKIFDKMNKGCSSKDCNTSCKDGLYEDPNNYGEGVTQYILEPLVMDQTTGCIVGGSVKYLKNGRTVALVYYSEDVSTKVLCVNGDCDDKKATCCTFVQDCDTDGPN